MSCVSLHKTSGVSLKQSLVLYGQATKCTRWMPRQLEAMKDVGACEKSRGAGKHALIRECPNGETHLLCRYPMLNT
jgi:hypothetical protein